MFNLNIKATFEFRLVYHLVAKEYPAQRRNTNRDNYSQSDTYISFHVFTFKVCHYGEHPVQR